MKKQNNQTIKKIHIFASQFKSSPFFEAFEFIKKDEETGLSEVLATCPTGKVPIPGSGKHSGR